MNNHTNKLLLAFVLTCLCYLAAPSVLVAVPKAKQSIRLETLRYDAYYHWGFIWKKAGAGVLTLDKEIMEDGSERFHGSLAGRSLSIVEAIMKVRDTLDCWLTPEYIPLAYYKKTHEGSYHGLDRNYYTTYFANDSAARTLENIVKTDVQVYRWRNKKGNSQKRHSVDAVAYDMLSVFYAIRDVDFSSMPINTHLQFPIFTGLKKQWMNVIYQGRANCELRSGKIYDTYQLLLTFQSKDSDSTPLYVWLSTDPDQRPLKVIIQLKRIGSLQGEIVE